MSNENKDRKLKLHEKPIWRKAFEASMSHTSIEGATRNAWKAVDAWNQANAFNEVSLTEYPSDTSNRNYKSLWDTLFEWFTANHEGLETEQIDQLLNAMEDITSKGATEADFKESLRSIYDSSE
jgi:hypothetical protein